MQCNLLDAEITKHPHMISTKRIEEHHSWKFNSLASNYANKYAYLDKHASSSSCLMADWHLSLSNAFTIAL
jgi:hypothetical protein